MAVIVPLVSKFDPKGVNNAKKAFGGLSKTLKSTVGAIGISLGLNAITNQLNAAAKAATADAKSQGLLANALKNTVSATNEQISAVETSISKMESMAAVADDQIRPVFAQLTRVTGDLGQATSLTSLALDVAAGTGRDLNSVAIALGKAYQGNSTALTRLGINVKGVSDPMALLEKQFAGSAEAAAKLDPYQRLEIVFGNLQEQIGAALLPYLNELADYFNSAEGQAKLKQFASDVADIATSVIDLADSLQLSGILDDLATLIERFAALSKLNFGKLAEQDASAAMESYVELYKTNRAAYDEKIAFLKRSAGADAMAIVAEIEKYVMKNRPATGQGGSVLDSYFGSTGLRGGLGTGIKIAPPPPPPKGLTGISDATKKAADAAKKASDAAKKAADEAAEALKKQVEALAEFSKELMGLTEGVKPLIALGREIGQFEQSTVDSFDAIAKSIQDGIGNGTIIARAGKNLLDYVATERKALTAIAQKRDELASKRGLAEALIGDVKAAVVGFAQITDLVNQETGNLTSNFADVVSKTKAFASQLKQLRELGLDKNLYKQIVDAGIDAGGATAAEIIAGGAGTVSELNNLFSELERAGAAIAEDTALVMYNNGVEVAGGLVAGLMSQEQALVEAAQTLADAFTRTFNSMITDLKVPSQEVEQITLSIADIAKGNTGIAGANSNVSRGLASNYLRRTGGEAAQTITITVNAGLGTNGKAVGQAIQAELNKYNRSNVALA